MDEEQSAGAVVFFGPLESPLYLLLHYEAGHWDFPKGHIEEGESAQDAMLRETLEESGLTVELVEGFEHKIDYVFRAKYDNHRIKHKTVIYFIARASTKEVRLSFEHKGYEWLTFDNALKRITYENSKEVLRRADTYLKSMWQKE